MSKHTPGPWAANEEFDDGESLGIAITAGRLGQVVRVFDVGQKGFANAALIAAAPDLLQALEMTLKELEEAGCGGSPLGLTLPSSGVEAARAAIAKATGEAA
jgi:hypothetical protein